MSRADYIKARLDLLKLVLSAILGFLLIGFWNVTQNESLIKNISKDAKISAIFMVIVAGVLIVAIFSEYYKYMNELENE